MVDEFTIESRTAEAITVQHVWHDHRFTFRVWNEPHGRVLRAGLWQDNEKAPLSGAAFCFLARAFAEREARKAGLID
jgi:hypothetical protein